MKATINPDLHWFVATFRPRKALDAMHAIRKAGFECYLPLKKRERWHKRARVRIEYDVPLMHPYMFVGFCKGALPFKAVTDLDEVGDFLRSSEREPLKVKTELIEAIFLAEINMEFDETTKAKKYREEAIEREFPIGSAVKLVEDFKKALDGAKGFVASHDPKRGKVKVEFGILSSWVDRGELEAA
jgi:transcription antitermination factor NusG